MLAAVEVRAPFEIVWEHWKRPPERIRVKRTSRAKCAQEKNAPSSKTDRSKFAMSVNCVP